MPLCTEAGNSLARLEEHTVRAGLYTLATTYAGCCAGFACYGTFVFVYTAYIYATAFGAFLAQLYNVARAGFHACTTCGTFIYVYNRQPGSDVECERTELTGCYAIAASETSESACGFAGVKAVDDGTTVEIRVLYTYDELENKKDLTYETASHINYYYGIYGEYRENDREYMSNYYENHLRKSNKYLTIDKGYNEWSRYFSGKGWGALF